MREIPAAELMAALRSPFQATDLEWRAMFTRGGDQGPLILVAPYVNRPAIINRLNQVCTIGGWQSDARVSNGHVYVGIGIQVGATWCWRWDGTGFLEADPPAFSASSAGKGDFSNAFKRCAEQWGIALYLRELKPMRAIVEQNGRYKSKVDNKVYRWEPPGIEGKADYPGEIPGWDREEGGEPGTSGAEPGEEPPKQQVTKPAALNGEQQKAELQRCKDHVRGFMESKHLRVYHLDAMIQTHGVLKHRYTDASQLGQKGDIADWQLIVALADGNGLRWEDAERFLAKEFPTGFERLELLDQEVKRLGKALDAEERLTIESAKRIGWNDAVEYWIEALGKR